MEEETRCGVETAGPPPERPEGRADGELYSLRGFSGREAENRAGAVEEYFGRAVSDMAGGSLLAPRDGARADCIGRGEVGTGWAITLRKGLTFLKVCNKLQSLCQKAPDR